MEILPVDVLFEVFQNLDPIDLVRLSRVNKRWYEIALHPKLHRSVNFHRRWDLSSGDICAYISRFKHSLENLNLQECYWIKATPLASALKRCTKLKTLNVIGCNVGKKALCSLIQQNRNLTTLGCSISPNDFQWPLQDRIMSELFEEVLMSFCNDLQQSFSALESLTVCFPAINPLDRRHDRFAGFMLKRGISIICNQSWLKTFCLQWLVMSSRGVQCVENGFGCQGFRLAETTGNTTFDTKYLSLQNVLLKAATQELEHGHLHTLIMPYNPFVLPAEVSTLIERLQVKSCVKNLDLGVLHFLVKSDCLIRILNAHCLRYLNLSGMPVDGHTLRAIATSSPNLEVLNLQDCHGCLSPIDGLQSLASFCPILGKLNLTGVHYHAQGSTSHNELMENVARFSNLSSLSLCDCGLGSSLQPSNNVSQEKKTLVGTLLQENKRFARGRNMQRRHVCGREVARNEGCCSASVQTNTLSSFVGTFAHLTKSCSKVTEFELIHWNLPGVYFTRKPIYPEQSIFKLRCHPLRDTSSDILSEIANWNNLQRLTLAVPFSIGSLEFLLAVAKNCRNLQFLSLASLSSLGHSGSVAILQESLSHCHQLRDFRLEQPHFDITESFLLSLGESVHLERICLILKDGNMKIGPQHIIYLFEKCHKLFFFIALCDTTIKASKLMNDSVKSRFESLRPGLTASVVPFHRNSNFQTCQEMLVKSIPVIHLKELFLFGTHVSVTVPQY